MVRSFPYSRFGAFGTLSVTGFQVTQPGLKLAGEPRIRAEEELAVDPHARIVLFVGEPQDLMGERDPLFEFTPEPVEAGQAPQDREDLRHLAVLLDERERLGVRILGPGGVAPMQRDGPGEARPE